MNIDTAKITICEIIAFTFHLKVPVVLSATKDRKPKRIDTSAKDVLPALSCVQFILCRFGDTISQGSGFLAGCTEKPEESSRRLTPC